MAVPPTPPSFWTSLSPWVQGIFGGTGATLVWEMLIKPSRERRSVAHVLAEEIGIALEMAVRQRLYMNRNTRGIPADFHIGTQVYESVARRLGELPTTLVGPVVLLYATIDQVNRYPEQFGARLDERSRLKSMGHTSEHTTQLESDMERTLVIFRETLETIVQRANAILPKLRRAAVPLWRLDYFFRRKKLLSIPRVDQHITDAEAKRQAQLPKKPRRK